jgi:hypothetical protein
MGPDQALPHALKRLGNSELEIESESLSSEGKAARLGQMLCQIASRLLRRGRGESTPPPPSHGDTMVLRFN